MLRYYRKLVLSKGSGFACTSLIIYQPQPGFLTHYIPGVSGWVLNSVTDHNIILMSLTQQLSSWKHSCWPWNFHRPNEQNSFHSQACIVTEKYLFTLFAKFKYLPDFLSVDGFLCLSMENENNLFWLFFNEINVFVFFSFSLISFGIKYAYSLKVNMCTTLFQKFVSHFFAKHAQSNITIPYLREKSEPEMSFEGCFAKFMYPENYLRPLV